VQLMEVRTAVVLLVFVSLWLWHPFILRDEDVFPWLFYDSATVP
jgi:hypothetical protein